MEPIKKPRITDINVAQKKAEHYCAYQERAQQEVRDKLYEWGLWTDAVELIISNLISENFLNEERFAKAYTQGKFNQKGWGKIKIKQGLKQKGVSAILIKKALQIIDVDAYYHKLKLLIDKKTATINEKVAFKRRYKLQQYALSRGYETDIIAEVLKDSDL
ncbi:MULTISPECIES: regulatory protein RecX [unclassified Mucilaginibacter]|uniref:regulatory protein RecX n=1 Tax=unclassified Mucilaginibacter TaxID=2617802 RepID=UPI000962034F|nr:MULTISPECIES: regulatory protein RecX [unclassified Mucilaginibacter]OJW18379.1 MAG: RecX family transcriptional regulator [Mucilaginibacter sp. 44-25]PLW88315.1 MAG: RecX family transcriptional regulator [Mucilaginibacter sp.]PMP65219.1 MAG: RecX family transcriptional regulator [Mucilaginibacter sp.]HEK19514.1 RecX family transcriptional regulator [Bacteroidota bacterium]